MTTSSRTYDITLATHLKEKAIAGTKLQQRSLPPLKAVGGPRCGHSSDFYVYWETMFCGLCFFREGYFDELPKKLHHTKRSLADNGNPQQVGKLESHVKVVEGIIAPLENQSLEAFARVRNALESRPATKQFPFASSLWEMMGKQPPLALTLVYAIHYPLDKVAAKLGVSVLNAHERLAKALNYATNLLRKYDVRNETSTSDLPSPPRSQERHPSDQPQAGSSGRQPKRHRSRRRRS